MSNTFISVQEIARGILPRLIDNLVFPMLCYKDYSNDFVRGKGDTVLVKKPVYLTAKDFTDGSDISATDIKEKTVPVTLDHLATVDVVIGAKEMALNVDDLNRLVFDPAASALAEKINEDGLKLYKDIPYIAGTAGTTPSALSDFSAARKILNKNKAPLANRYAVWDTDADAKFTEIGNLVKVNESGENKGLREGEIGRVFGLDNYMSQAIQSHTSGGTGTVLIAEDAAAGATSIKVDGVTASFKVGDVLSIADTEGTYVVTAFTTLAATAQTLTIYPALLGSAGNDKAVTVTGNHVANLAFHKNAFAFVTRPLIAPAGTESYTISQYGISLRVVRQYSITTKRETTSVDILYGYKTMCPELAVRYLG